MPTTDALGNRCDRKLRLHIRRLHHLAFDPYQTLRCTQQVFGPIGVSGVAAHCLPNVSRRKSRAWGLVADQSFADLGAADVGIRNAPVAATVHVTFGRGVRFTTDV